MITLETDQLEYLASSKEARLASYNAAGIAQRGRYLAAEINVANAQDEAIELDKAGAAWRNFTPIKAHRWYQTDQTGPTRVINCNCPAGRDHVYAPECMWDGNPAVTVSAGDYGQPIGPKCARHSRHVRQSDAALVPITTPDDIFETLTAGELRALMIAHPTSPDPLVFTVIGVDRATSALERLRVELVEAAMFEQVYSHLPIADAETLAYAERLDREATEQAARERLIDAKFDQLRRWRLHHAECCHRPGGPMEAEMIAHDERIAHDPSGSRTAPFEPIDESRQIALYAERSDVQTAAYAQGMTATEFGTALHGVIEAFAQDER